jgi:short-subunit dehydrogenase
MCQGWHAMASKKEEFVSPLRQSVVITGASKGLGEALARLYANPGRTLGLLGRDRHRLEAVAARCRDQGAHVVVAALDVKDGAGLARWFTTFDAKHPVDLLIVNAGMFTGHGKFAPETVQEMTELVRTNLEGAALTISAAVPMMRARQSGRIAIVGSLAALHPLADAPAYSASKAGVMAYGEALCEWLAPDNVAVSLIYPGHIKTAQVEHHVARCLSWCRRRRPRASSSVGSIEAARSSPSRRRSCGWSARDAVCPGACGRCWVGENAFILPNRKLRRGRLPLGLKPVPSSNRLWSSNSYRPRALAHAHAQVHSLS